MKLYNINHVYLKDIFKSLKNEYFDNIFPKYNSNLKFPQNIFYITHNIVTSQEAFDPISFSELVSSCNCLQNGRNCNDNSCSNVMLNYLCNDKTCSILIAHSNNEALDDVCQNNHIGLSLKQTKFEIQKVKNFSIVFKLIPYIIVFSVICFL